MIELVHLLEQATGKQAQVQYHPANPADMLASWANVEKAGRLLGWEPQVPLREGVARLVQWYNTEREWASQINTE